MLIINNVTRVPFNLPLYNLPVLRKPLPILHAIWPGISQDSRGRYVKFSLLSA